MLNFDNNISILVDIVQANIEQINEKLDTGYEKIDLIIDLLNSILECLERIKNSTCERSSVLGVVK